MACMHCPAIRKCEERQKLTNSQGVWAGKLHTKESVKPSSKAGK